MKVELIIMISHPEAERVGGFDTPHANEADGERGLWVLDRYLGSSSHVKAQMFSIDRRADAPASEKDQLAEIASPQAL